MLLAAAVLAGGLAYLATLPLTRKLRVNPKLFGLPVALVVGSVVVAVLFYGPGHLGTLNPEPDPDPNKIVGIWVATMKFKN